MRARPAGWRGRSGATVHVHTVGAPHLADPHEAAGSARRIYGDADGLAVGRDDLPVPARQVHALRTAHRIDVARSARARHRYPRPRQSPHGLLLDGLCITGDVAAIRLPGCRSMCASPRRRRRSTSLPGARAWLVCRTLRPDRLLLTHFGPVERDAAGPLADRGPQPGGCGRPSCASVDRRTLPAGQIVEAYASGWPNKPWPMAPMPIWSQRYEIIVPSAMLVPGLLRYCGCAAPLP